MLVFKFEYKLNIALTYVPNFYNLSWYDHKHKQIDGIHFRGGN